jgi:hypothetical protein
MYRFWSTIIEPLCIAADIRSIVEVGIGEGHMTRLLMAYAKRCGGNLQSIDPAPTCDMITLCAEGGPTFTYHAAKSTDALPPLHSDLVLIDGDHNWYTVLQELRILSQWVSSGSIEPIILLHDTGWPYGQRDLYYDKDTIPAAYRRPSARRGMLPSKAGLEHIGGLNADLENALEDFLKEEIDRWHWQELPGIHGLGILVPRSRLIRQPAVATLLKNIHPNAFQYAHMENIESNRLRKIANNATIMQRLRKRDEQVHMLDERWRLAQQEIASLKQAIADKEQANLQITHGFEQEIAQQISQLSVLQDEQRQLHALIDNWEKRHAEFQKALAHAQKNLDHIHSTRTFRWTAWIRKAAGLLCGRNR